MMTSTRGWFWPTRASRVVSITISSSSRQSMISEKENRGSSRARGSWSGLFRLRRDGGYRVPSLCCGSHQACICHQRVATAITVRMTAMRTSRTDRLMDDSEDEVGAGSRLRARRQWECCSGDLWDSGAAPWGSRWVVVRLVRQLRLWLGC